MNKKGTQSINLQIYGHEKIRFCSPGREARTDWTPSWTIGTTTVSWMVASPWTCCMGDPWCGWGTLFHGPLTLNWKVVAATAWSLCFSLVILADPLQVKLKWPAGLSLLPLQVDACDTSCPIKALGWREGCWAEDNELPLPTTLLLLTHCGEEETKASKAWADNRLDSCL